ncbi:MAG: DUF4160 domain-containing protein [Rhodospirillales bacterium]|nr:DUF4160 domain-containing protein [Rhodospirillales bacterium]
MVTLYREAAWRIAVYGRDHGTPHFHIEGPGFRASVSIEALELIVGAVPAAILRAARNWARRHQSELMATWRELNG